MIDISIATLTEKARTSGKDDTLYFPSGVYEGIKTSNKVFKQAKLTKEISQLNNVCNLKQIVAPVHMPNHWGLVYVDLASINMYFDDGLALPVPCTVYPAVKELLDLVAEMYTSHPTLQTRFWQKCNNFKRFGMP